MGKAGGHEIAALWPGVSFQDRGALVGAAPSPVTAQRVASLHGGPQVLGARCLSPRVDALVRSSHVAPALAQRARAWRPREARAGRPGPHSVTFGRD